MQPELVTEVLLSHWRVGDEQARDGLISRLYPELAQIAAARLRSERNSSLSTGDLLNDAVMRLMQREAFSIADRAHFLALASRMMRHILIDHARAKGSAKRRHVRVEISSRIDGEQRFDLIALEVALVRLGAIDHRLMELVEMRYFGGMSVSDVAVVTGWSEPTVKRRWQTARAWLTDALMNPVRDN